MGRFLSFPKQHVGHAALTCVDPPDLGAICFLIAVPFSTRDSAFRVPAGFPCFGPAAHVYLDRPAFVVPPSVKNPGLEPGLRRINLVGPMAVRLNPLDFD
jgi:hypothetical protein